MSFAVYIERSPYDKMIDYLTGDSFPIAYTKEEGGNWLAIGPDRRLARPVAAILFESGWIYDFVLDRLNRQPWRRLPLRARPLIRIKARRAVNA